jgi:DNA helicase MCM8
VLENLNMAEPLLSRFDLVFILLDASDEQRDRHLSEHVMALHSGEGGSIVTVQLTSPLNR